MSVTVQLTPCATGSHPHSSVLDHRLLGHFGQFDKRHDPKGTSVAAESSYVFLWFTSSVTSLLQKCPLNLCSLEGGLALSSNSLSGMIPSELGSCQNLRTFTSCGCNLWSTGVLTSAVLHRLSSQREWLFQATF